MIRFASLILVCLTMGTVPARALDLTLPSSAVLTAGENLGFDSYALPNAPFDGIVVPARKFEGFVQRQAWRVNGTGITPLQVLQPLRDELESTGYTNIFECSDDDCGGFDFRFGTDSIAAPNMIVDLDDYHVVSFLKGDDDSPSAAANLLVSRSRDAVYVQIISVSVDQNAAISVDKGDAITGSTQPAVTAQIKDVSKVEFASQIDSTGHVILSDLVFATGSADLGSGPFESLQKIADYLAANPSRRIALVGHTDAVGGLNGNIALSKRRAGSVKSRLVDKFDVPDAQLVAEGMGFLAPVASNLTDAGRETNRRVEAVLISTE